MKPLFALALALALAGCNDKDAKLDLDALKAKCSKLNGELTRQVPTGEFGSSKYVCKLPDGSVRDL